MSPAGASYLQHLQWVEAEIVAARKTMAAEQKLAKDARGMSAIIERREGYQEEASKLAASVVDQAERQCKVAEDRVSALEAEAARTRAALAGIEQ